MRMPQIETVLTTTLLPLYDLEGRTVVVIDVLRATSSICTALSHGATAIIPVASRDEAIAMRQRGYLLASEREGMRQEFAQMGNSPSEFSPERVAGQEIVYCTTNGTQAITAASKGAEVLIGAFLNRTALVRYLAQRAQRDVLFLCSGWKGRFNIEDTLLAGAIAEALVAERLFTTSCDSTLAAMDLWSLAKANPLQYAEKVAHRQRLESLGLGASFYDCFRLDTCELVPRYANGRITAAGDTP